MENKDTVAINVIVGVLAKYNQYVNIITAFELVRSSNCYRY